MFQVIKMERFTLTICLILLILAACQSPSPSPPPPALTPTFVLIPPIQPGDGTDLIDRLLQTGVVRVGVRVWPDPEFSPPVFRDVVSAQSGGALTGFEVEVARQVAEGLGLELELIEADPRLLQSGEWQGRWDLAMGSLVPFDQPLDPSAQNLRYSIPYGYMPMGLLVPASETQIQSLADLSTRRVGVLEHSAYQRLITPGEPSLTIDGQPLLPQQPPANLQLIVLSNLPKSIRNLGQTADAEAPQVDAIFGPAPVFQEAVASGLLVKLFPEGESLGLQPLVIAATPQAGLKVDRLITEINGILERLQRQGTLAEIYLEWYGQDLSEP